MARQPRQLYRDTAATLDAYTGPAGEPMFDTTNKRLRMNDGSTAGGIAIPKLSETLTLAMLSAIGHANVALTAAVAANALTIALKDAAGSDPSAGSPANFWFRSPTAATGTPVNRQVTAASSLVISSGSTLGAASGTPFKLWIVAFDDGGTIRLGVINCLGGTAPSLTIYPLAQFGIASSTAEGGAGGADSAQVFYTGTAVTSKAYAVLGYMEWASGLTAAGTWDAGPTRIQMFGLGVPLPGTVVQRARSQTGAVATTTTVLPNDDTIPQNTEGGEFMTQAVTPSAASNLLRVSASFYGGCSVNGAHAVALFQDATANALAASWSPVANVAATQGHHVALSHLMRPGTTSSTTLKLRAGPASAGTLTFNGAGGARALGGVGSSFLEIEEIAA